MPDKIIRPPGDDDKIIVEPGVDPNKSASEPTAPTDPYMSIQPIENPVFEESKKMWDWPMQPPPKYIETERTAWIIGDTFQIMIDNIMNFFRRF